MEPSDKTAGAETPSLRAADVKNATGMSYRQLNDWDGKGALPSQREQGSGWRKFTPREIFVLMVCSELRKRFGVPLEKLAWLQSFMLQKGADHFQAALHMMRYGYAVFILTDCERSFDMESDREIGELLKMGYCRYDAPQAYVLLCVNPLVNRMLKALKQPRHLEISDRAYNAQWEAEARYRVQDHAELAVLEAMRNPDLKRFSVTPKGKKEILLEVEQELPEGQDINAAVRSHDFQTVIVKRHQGKNVRILRALPKKISREKLRQLLVVRLGESFDAWAQSQQSAPERQGTQTIRR